MVVQQPQVQSQVQPQVQQQTAVPTAQGPQIVGSGVQVRATGAEGVCSHQQVCVHLSCMELDLWRSVVRVVVGSGPAGKAQGFSLAGTR